MNTSQNTDSAQLPIFFYLKWVAKIALSIGVLAIASLLAELFLITSGKGTEYSHIIHANSLTWESLGPAIMVFGLVMTIAASFIAWLVSLYGSFRIAGPLYRFSQNMKSAIDHPSAKPVAIRHGDMLQQEWKAFDASLGRLDTHYRCLREALAEVRKELGSEGADTDAVRRAVSQLRKVERLVEL